jgi:hypothetical protein
VFGIEFGLQFYIDKSFDKIFFYKYISYMILIKYIAVFKISFITVQSQFKIFFTKIIGFVTDTQGIFKQIK